MMRISELEGNIEMFSKKKEGEMKVMVFFVKEKYTPKGRDWDVDVKFFRGSTEEILTYAFETKKLCKYVDYYIQVIE